MKTPFSFSATVSLAVSAVIILSLASLSHGLGSGATLAISDAGATVCAVVAGESTRYIECYRQGQVVPIFPNVSFSTISGGRDYFCGIRTDNSNLFCWNTSSSFERKRLYNNSSFALENLAVGETHVCATVVGGGAAQCWRAGDTFQLPSESDEFASISSGSGFSCGILKNGSLVRCWGDTNVSERIENEFGNMSMLSIVAGGSHVCGLNSTGFLVCKGSNSSGQLDFPQGGAFEYSVLALGIEHGCAVRGLNGSVVCWGGNGRFSVNVTEGVSFEVIVSGSNFVCGLTTKNLTVVCWGPGWSNSSRFELPLPRVLPGACVESSCGLCGSYIDSQSLCSGSGSICKPVTCRPQTTVPPPPPPLSPPPPPPPSVSPPPPPPPPPPSSTRSKSLTRGLLAFAIIGSVGGFAGICTIVYCLWSGVCFGKKKVHNSVQPTITRGSSNGGGTSNNSGSSISSMIMRQTSIIMRRQRSGTSSTKHPDRAEEFTLAELVAATNNFSLENKIGAGSYGVVYKGKLADGREVAIKRGETGSKMKKFQEKESAFESELSFLSRLHHKHLVGLVGFCEEKDERLLVYEYMQNGALYDHLHDKNNVEKSSSLLNNWKMRIKIALDASRGIEYLHNYAIPSIIHRNIKSSNILLDATQTARVSDFELSFMRPDSDCQDTVVGTVGYIDPEYSRGGMLTTKSDVYGFGVVLLELLTGKRPIFKSGEDGCSPLSVVDLAVPTILAGYLVKILDPCVEPPDVNEAEALELVAYTAIHCVNLKGKYRPTMFDIMVNLEQALYICCNGSYDSISSYHQWWK